MTNTTGGAVRNAESVSQIGDDAVSYEWAVRWPDPAPGEDGIEDCGTDEVDARRIATKYRAHGAELVRLEVRRGPWVAVPAAE